MKMGAIEKRFVNSPRHSRRVAERAERRIRRSNPRPGQHLLEVGCGNGATAIHLATTFTLAVTGVDIDPDQVDAATTAGENHPETRFLVADATSLPFPDEVFDLVYTSKTTHHVRAWQRSLAEMARVLKPEGQLLYSDFTAPVGNRLPTRRGVENALSEHGLSRVRRSSAPFHTTATYRKRDTEAASPRRERTPTG